MHLSWQRHKRRRSEARQIDYPPDVADAEALRHDLLETGVFAHAPAEANAYVSDALERFRVTMALLPDLPAGARVLELGANPYFITRLLRRRGLDVTCANWFGEGTAYAAHDRQATVRADGSEESFEFDHFNVEHARFPYPDASFDLVLCCELIEHLPNDPVHLLAEAHRVLRQPDGQLLLTTPNAVRSENLERLQRGANVYESLSGYGTYGRHNREYTTDELRSLFEECGYVVDDAFDLDLPTHDSAGAPPGRGTNLFVRAHPVGDARWRYPEWLFTSLHALYRAVRPDLVVGVNDDLQSQGFHELESMHGRATRWTGLDPVSRVLLSPSFTGPGHLVIEGIAAPTELGRPVNVTAEAPGLHASWEVPSDGAPFRVRTPVTTVTQADVELLLSTEPSWRPVDIGLSADPRTLGVAIASVGFEPSRVGPLSR